MKNISLALMTGVLGLIAAQHAAWAGFSGSVVSLGHYVPRETTPFDGPYNVTVVSAGADGGSADRKLISPFASCDLGYGVTVLDDSVVVDFVARVDFTAGEPFHGLIIKNLVRPGATASIVETNPHTIFSYDGATLKLDWQGQTIPAGATYTISFTAGACAGAPVQTPCSAEALGACTRDAGEPSPICTDADAGSSPNCPGVGPVDAAKDIGADAANSSDDAADSAGERATDGGEGRAPSNGDGAADGGGQRKTSSGCNCAIASGDPPLSGLWILPLIGLVLVRRRHR